MSSFITTYLEANPGMWWSWDPITWELKVGSAAASMISR
jgi:hypothetical protein